MPPPESDPEFFLLDAFRRASWRVRRLTSGDSAQPAWIVENRQLKYAVEFKRSSEGRRDRIIPLLSQAILEGQANANRSSATQTPLAVVSAPHIAPSVAESALAFVQRVAPEAAAGLIDDDGLRAFRGHGLEVLNAQPSAKERRARRGVAGPRLPHLFSDLNQWMLKILLAESIPAHLLSAPRQPFRNPTALAKAAGVSVMSATRLVRQLILETHLHPDEDGLRLTRIPELLHRWSAQREPVQEIPVRWLVKRDHAALAAQLRSHCAHVPSTGNAATSKSRAPRLCLGLFAAADLLGFGFVHGVPAHLYMEWFDQALLKKLGLSATGAEHTPDAYIRIPSNPESIFRAAVTKDGVPCADILQIWLDVSAHPSRGKAQASEIARRCLGALLKRK